ncbi:MAG: polysaccharide deacetylase family protein [bacterium]
MCLLLLWLLFQSLQSTPIQDRSYYPFQIVQGGIIRTDQSQKQINLVFTGHEFADGGEHIRSVLAAHAIKASFFLTGDFYRNTRFSKLIQLLKTDGHYLGAHSDKHLLYASWEKRDSLLVTKRQFTEDLLGNYNAMKKFGITKNDAPYFLPPYEWYNDSISAWTLQMGFTLVNFTPGTYSNADWTHPALNKQYLSSDMILTRILRYEKTHLHGLNGFILLLHIGTDPRRTDKFYYSLDTLLTELKKQEYRFTLFQQTIPGKE